MTPTHARDIAHHSHDGNTSNAPNALNHARRSSGGFLKRTRALLVTFLVVGVLAAGFMIVSGRAAGLGIHLPASVAKIFASRTPSTAPVPRMVSAQETQPLAPLAAADAVPILYYDFENNATRTTFENLVEQAVNTGSGALTLNTISGGAGVAGAGTFNGGAAAGQAITATNWSSSTTDPGTAAANYFQFVVNTTGFSGLSVTFDSQASSTGPARVGILFSTDGSTFTTTSTGLVTSATFTGNSQTFSLGAGANNQSSVTLRIYAFAGSAGDRATAPAHGAFGATGTFRIDNLTVRANTVTASKTLLDYPAIGLGIKSGTAFNPAYGDFTVNGAGITISLASALQESGTFTVSSGTLNCGTNAITGAGAFTLSSGATLGIGSTAGITSTAATGNIQVTGTRTYSATANYIYTGSANQAVGNQLPATVANLTIANTGGVGSNTVTGNSGQAVSGLLRVQSGVYSSASDYVDVQIDAAGTLSLAADITVSGNWSNAGTFNANAFGVTFDGSTAQSISGGSATAFAGLTISNTGNAVTLNQNASDTSLNVTSGTFSQAGTSNLTSGAVTVSSGATWSNLGMGDLTLSGNVANAGTITFNASGASCGDADDIAISSSAGGTQRTWSGAGTFSMTDVSVSDQRTPVVPPPVAIIVNSGTNLGNNLGWVFSGTCVAGTYTWIGGVNADWQVPTNWSPTRALPAAGDILIFDGNATPAPIVSNVPTETDAALRLTNGVFGVTLNAATVPAGQKTFTISGGAVNDLSIPAGTLLTLSGSEGLTIALTGANTSTIGGQIIFQGGPHRLIGANAGEIHFNSTSIFTNTTGFAGNPFGSGTSGSVVFESGSNAFFNAGSDPFGGNPSSVTQFASGSSQTLAIASAFSSNGRTYGNLTLNGSQAYSAASANANTVANNLTIGGGSSLTLSSTAGGNLNVGGNWANSGTFTPSGRTVTFNGSGATQTISGTNAFADLTISHSGAGTVTAAGSTLSVTGLLDVASGTFTSATAYNNVQIDAAGTLDLSGPITVSGNWTKNGIFNSNGFNVSFDGGSNQTVGGTGSNDFSDLTIQGAGITLTTNAAVSSVLALNSGDITTGSNTLTQSGTSVGTTDVVGNVKRSDVGASAKAFGNPNNQISLQGGSVTEINVNLVKSAPSTFTSAVTRTYSITPTGASGINATLRLHYLDAELNGNSAGSLDFWRSDDGGATYIRVSAMTRVTGSDPNNYLESTGVNQFSDWVMSSVPSVPTAVRLMDFSATRNEHNEVMLQWRSGYEVRNLGYRIYREQDGKRTQITPSLVAGSALMAGRNTEIMAGLSYTWYDDLNGGRGKGEEVNQQSAISSQKSPVTYWLEDVDLDGTQTLHGPIAISECGVGAADCKRLGERSRLLGELTNKQSAISNQQTGSGVLFSSYPAAITKPDSSDNEPDPTEMQRTIAGLPGLKVSVSRPGWYRITQPEVLAAGFSITDANGLQLYRNGRQVPLRLSNSTEQFGPSDYLEFYGEGLNSLTERAQTYYLVKLAEPGKRIEVKERVVGPADRVNPQGFAYTVERKERMIYFFGLLNGDAENFFGQVLSTSPINATIPISHLDPSSSAPVQLEVALQGVTSQNHLVHVRLNGTDLGTINFANTEHPNQMFNVPAAAVHDGDNQVELTSLASAADISLVDVLRLTYIRDYTVDNNALSFSLQSRQTKRLTGFSSANIRIVDVRNPYEPIELTPYIAPDGAGFSALIGVDMEVRAPFSRPHQVLAFADGQTDAVDNIRLNETSSWWSQTAGADYLIITSSDFTTNVEPLAQLRRNQGMVVQVVNVEDLYDEFSFGEHSPQAIRDFLGTATNSWTRKPHYVLLAGDASYDPKNYLASGSTDSVPTKLVDTNLMETASDDWLADFDHDGVSDLAVGRLPVRTPADASAMVNKIIAYESTAPDPQRGVLLVADNNFESESNSLQALVPQDIPVQTINRSSNSDAAIHSQIVNAINQGQRVVNYTGHGSNGVWTSAPVLSIADAPNLTNSNRPSLFVALTCLNGYFQDAYYDSLAEALLRSPGGAVAVWTSSGMTEPNGQVLADQELYRQLFKASPPTLGDAVRTAKYNTVDTNIRRTWILFGDPAMRLR